MRYFFTFAEYKKLLTSYVSSHFVYLSSFQSIFVKSMISSFFNPRFSSLNCNEFTSVRPAPFGSSLNTLAITASSMEVPVFLDTYSEFPSSLKS